MSHFLTHFRASSILGQARYQIADLTKTLFMSESRPVPGAKFEPFVPRSNGKGEAKLPAAPEGRWSFLRRSESLRWGLIGLVLLMLALGILEGTQPYYFSQDDVLTCDYPPLLYALRSVWSGVLPAYNPYMYLGGPLLSVGRGTTYPLLYLAYAIARHGFGNEYLTLEILAMLHLTVGYVAVFLVARRARMRGPVACLVALTFVLCGPVLIMGRSWFQVVGVAAYSPLLILAAERLRRPVGWRWCLTTSVLVGLYYHLGFPQLWFLGVNSFVLHVAGLVFARVVPWRRALWVLPALMIAAGLIFPLVEQQGRLIREMTPDSAYGWGIENYLVSMVVPYPLHVGVIFGGIGSLHEYKYGGHFFYSGTLLVVLFLVALVDALARWARLVPRRRGLHVWTFCGLVAFMLCLGLQGYLWRLIEFLPAGLRNNPIRVLPLFVLYASLSGGLVLERLLEQLSRRRLRWLGLALVVAAYLLVFHHVTCSRSAFYNFGFRPFPDLPADLTQLLREPDGETCYRNIYCAPERSIDPTYVYSLAHAWPTLYEVPAILGYDPLVGQSRRSRRVMQRLKDDCEATLRAYGVRWVLIHRTVWQGNPLSPGASRRWETEVRFDPNAVQFAAVHQPASLQGVVKVGEIRSPDPLCFVQGAPERPIPLHLDGRGITANLGRPASGQTLIVNFFADPVLYAYLDGKPAAVRSDPWERIVLDVPPGAEKLELLYQPSWRRGLLVGAGLLLLGLAAIPVAARYSAPRQGVAPRVSRFQRLASQLARILPVLGNVEDRRAILSRGFLQPAIGFLGLYGILAAGEYLFFNYLRIGDHVRICFGATQRMVSISTITGLLVAVVVALLLSLVVPRAFKQPANDRRQRVRAILQIVLVLVGFLLGLLVLLAKAYLTPLSLALWTAATWRPWIKLVAVSTSLLYLAILLSIPYDPRPSEPKRHVSLRIARRLLATAAAVSAPLILLTRPLPQPLAANVVLTLLLIAYLGVAIAWLRSREAACRRGV